MHHHPHKVSSKPASTACFLAMCSRTVPSCCVWKHRNYSSQSLRPIRSSKLSSSQDVSSSPALDPREALQRLKQGREFQARTQDDTPTRKMNEEGKATEKGPKEEGGVVAHAYMSAVLRRQSGDRGLSPHLETDWSSSWGHV